tara:strand:- start:623 stop:1123 length:501 start_codon:yes stop_codon:yes gene_type:complete
VAETNLRGYSIDGRLNKMDVDIIDVDPTCEAAGNADGDVIFTFTEIPNCVSVDAGSCLLHSVQLLDDDDNGGAIDLVFQSDNTTLGSIGAAVSESDANAGDILGYVSLTTYFDGIAWQMSTKTNIGLVLKAAASTKSIYVAGVNRSGSSQTATAAGIHLKIGVIKD